MTQTLEPGRQPAPAQPTQAQPTQAQSTQAQPTQAQPTQAQWPTSQPVRGAWDTTPSGGASSAPTTPLDGTASDPWSAPPAPPAQPAPPASSPSGGRRPGWAALTLASLGAAVLASGLTLGGVQLLDGTTTSSATGSSTSRDQSPQVPVDAGGADGVAWPTVASAVSPSVVSITVAGQSGDGQGSGSILDAKGHILTNNHVVTGAGDGAQIRVTLSDGRVFDDVSVVGKDASTDLAVLKIASPPDDLVSITLGDSDAVTVGQPVMAVGNPLGLSDSVTTGIVSAVDRPVVTSSSEADPFSGGGAAAEPVVTNAIQTDAAVNPGNSGGALVDASGRLIGIPSSIAGLSSGSGQAGSIGLGFAIPVNEAKRIAEELITAGSAGHPQLGVRLEDSTATADGATRQGSGITEVTEGSAAAQAGLRAGDVVVSVDGEAVSGAESLTAQIRERGPGDEVTLGVIRDQQSIEVTAQLGTRDS